jgi:hypothetical protein
MAAGNKRAQAGLPDLEASQAAALGTTQGDHLGSADGVARRPVRVPEADDPDVVLFGQAVDQVAQRRNAPIAGLG